LPTKLLLNMAYLRSRSFRQDVKLILLTVRYSRFPQRFDADLVRKSLGLEPELND